MLALTTLTCNRFLNGSTFSGTKYGLYVEDGVLMNDIGGDGQGAGFGDPNANVFPTTGTRPTQDKFTVNNQDGWDVPSDFVAVRFPVNSQAVYYSYGNEFVGEVLPDPNINLVVTGKDCYTDANIPASPGPDEVQVCPTLGSNDVYFPLRVGVISSTGKSLNANRLLYPNPAKDVLNIEGISSEAKVWEVTDVLGKRHMVKATVSSSTTQLDLRSLSSGLYSIRLEGKTFKFIKE
jgi:hypothetical protein